MIEMICQRYDTSNIVEIGVFETRTQDSKLLQFLPLLNAMICIGRFCQVQYTTGTSFKKLKIYLYNNAITEVEQEVIFL